jgi:hypothetical protein
MSRQQGREAPHFSIELSIVFDKKVGVFNKKESGSLMNQGLEIPKVYRVVRRIFL